MEDRIPEHIVFFDGVCNFCNSTVDRIFRSNTSKNIFFSSLQSDFAASFLLKHGLRNTDLDTVLYYRKGRFFDRTDALIEISRELSGIYKVVPAMKILPKFLRDAGYRWFASNRYRFFGKKETCRIPTAEERSRFLE